MACITCSLDLVSDAKCAGLRERGPASNVDPTGTAGTFKADSLVMPCPRWPSAKVAKWRVLARGLRPPRERSS